MGKKLEFSLSILNGAIGDYLARTKNNLATPMTFVDPKEPIQATSRVAVLVHGLMCNETIWDFAGGENYGSMLARDFGYTPLYLRYNSGLSIRENGESLHRLLSALEETYPLPIEELLLVGYSMGGLLLRSAVHFDASSTLCWVPRVRRAIYVGTPHQGAPLERFGRFASKLLGAIDDPYTRLVAEIAELRSLGVKDLGDAEVPPLMDNIRHYLIAGTVSGDLRLGELLGDAIIPLSSAVSGSILPAERIRILSGLNHVDLAHHPRVYQVIKEWCEEPL